MAFNNSSNIAMGGFERVHYKAGHGHHKKMMSLDGTLNKTLILLLLVIVGGFVGWTFIPSVSFLVLVIASLVISLVIAITLAFKPLLAKYLAPVYAIFEGYFLGVVSLFFEAVYPGIVFQAILLTVAIAVLMNFLYRYEIIKVTDKFRSVLIAVTMGIFVVYMISFGMSLILGSGIPLIHESGTVGILFSLFVVVIASLNLLLDFDFIDRQVAHKTVKDMEWYGAFALIVTLVWIYIEVLKLLAKLYSRE